MSRVDLLLRLAIGLVGGAHEDRGGGGVEGRHGDHLLRPRPHRISSILASASITGRASVTARVRGLDLLEGCRQTRELLGQRVGESASLRLASLSLVATEVS